MDPHILFVCEKLYKRNFYSLKSAIYGVFKNCRKFVFPTIKQVASHVKMGEGGIEAVIENRSCLLNAVYRERVPILRVLYMRRRIFLYV